MKSTGSAATSKTTSLVVLILLGVLLPGVALGEKRVVILDFTGKQAAKAHRMVVAVVARENEVVSAKDFKRTQRELKIRKLNDKTVARIAAEMQVDVVVAGGIRKKNGRWKLVVAVRQGTDGDVIGTGEVKLTKPRVDPSVRGQIAAEVLPLIAMADEIGDRKVAAKGRKGRKPPVVEEDPEETPDEPVEDDPPPTRKGRKAPIAEEDPEETPDEPVEDDPPPTRKGRRTPVVERDPAEDPEPTVEDDPPPTRKGRKTAAANLSLDEPEENGGDETGDDKKDQVDDPTKPDRFARHAGADLHAGVSFIGRNMSFTYKANAMMPWGYAGNPVPGVTVNAEIYPLSFGDNTSFTSGLGVAVNFDRVLTLRSRLRTGDVEYSSSQMRWGVGARYRWNIGTKPTTPTVKFMLGFNGLSFTIGAPDNSVELPDVAYTFVDVGAGARFPLGSPRLAVSLEARYLQVLSAGAMQEEKNYGGAKINGVDMDLNFEFRPIRRLVIRVGGKYTRIGYTFNGTGELLERTDDGMMDDVGGALDQYFGGYVTGGYLF